MKIFELTLKHEKEKSYRQIILLLVVLHVLFFTHLVFDQQFWKKGLAGLVVTLLYAGYRLFETKKRKQNFSFSSGYFYVIGIVSIIMQLWPLAVVDLVLALLSQMALEKTSFRFSESIIVKKTINTKNFNWNQMANVILKDDILTMDYKSNKLLQAEIETKNVNEKAFNTFAKAQLNK